jgi:hypothetical protein
VAESEESIGDDGCVGDLLLLLGTGVGELLLLLGTGVGDLLLDTGLVPGSEGGLVPGSEGGLVPGSEGGLVPGSEVPGTDGEIFSILIIFRRYLSVGRKASKWKPLYCCLVFDRLYTKRPVFKRKKIIPQFCKPILEVGYSGDTKYSHWLELSLHTAIQQLKRVATNSSSSFSIHWFVRIRFMVSW